MRNGAEQLMLKFLCLPLFLLAALPAWSAPKLAHLSSYHWVEKFEAHGGYSGLHLAPDGTGFVTVTDKGDYVTGDLLRHNNQIIGVRNVKSGFLKPPTWAKNTRPNGRPHPFDSNAEGLAVAPDGKIWVAFEGFHRLRVFDAIDGPAGGVEGHPHFKHFQSNAGLEALAVDAKGRFYTLPERSGKWTRPFTVYRLTGKTWETWAKLPRRDRFLPTGADIGPDGKFYLVERRFEYLQGFATRVRRFEMAETGLTNEETLLESPFRTYGNVESISVWTAKSGALRVTLLTDDNFSFLQKTQFHEFAISGE